MIERELLKRGIPAAKKYKTSGDAEKGEAQVELPLYHLPKKDYWRNYWRRLSYLWRVPRTRRALLCACTVIVAQQLTGVNTIGKLPCFTPYHMI